MIQIIKPKTAPKHNGRPYEIVDRRSRKQDLKLILGDGHKRVAPGVDPKIIPNPNGEGYLLIKYLD